MRLTALIGLPLITLLLGWQIGARYEQQKLQELSTRLESLYSVPTGSGAVQADPQKEVDLSLFWSVWRLLLQHYIEPADLKTREMIFGAVRGLVSGVGDPYTVFMTPVENKDFRQALQGKLQGIGAELAVRDGRVVVVAPLKGSPAMRAGLLPDDVIVEVDSQSVEGVAFNEVVRRIRGPEGTDVRLTILREGKPGSLSITITRADIKIPSVESRVIKTASGSVALIALNQFGDTSLVEIREALKGFQKERIRGLILDVRFNGGGYLEAAVDLTSLFLREGVVVSVERGGQGAQVHRVSSDAPFADLPLVMLVNEGSASASEIVAGALQDNGRATIVGMKTFGKGTVQEVIDLPGGSSLRVTVARWLTPKGKDLGREGVHPDVVVERTKEEMQVDRDPQLERAISILLEKGEPNGSQKDFKIQHSEFK